jgi:tetratricopeptide (TPR) repeat protein
VFSEDFVLPELEGDGYAIIQRQTSGTVHLEHGIVFIIKNDADYKWEGILHEYLITKENKEFPLFKNVINEYLNDGHRSKDPLRTHKDIALLKTAIQKDPTNLRHYGCLARTYLQQSNYKAALKYFTKSANKKSHPYEVYHSLLNIAVCQRMLNYDPEIFIKSFCLAHSYRPSRAEALYELALYYTDTENHLMGYILSKIVMAIPLTSDYLFVAPWVYDWGGTLLFFLSARGIGALDEALAALEDLLKNPTLPQTIHQHFKLKECHKELTESLSKLTA